MKTVFKLLTCTIVLGYTASSVFAMQQGTSQQQTSSSTSSTSSDQARTISQMTPQEVVDFINGQPVHQLNNPFQSHAQETQQRHRMINDEIFAPRNFGRVTAPIMVNPNAPFYNQRMEAEQLIANVNGQPVARINLLTQRPTENIRIVRHSDYDAAVTRYTQVIMALIMYYTLQNAQQGGSPVKH